MSDKRKDHKGHILKAGESQRKDLRYQYRYADPSGERHTIYASTLQELRKKEAEIQQQLDSGLNYVAGNVTVSELVERYLSTKQGVRPLTAQRHESMLRIIKNDPFGNRRISSIRTSDAKQWMLHLHKQGRSYGTLGNVRGVIKPAFQMACDDDAILKNPFSFKLSDVVPNDAKKRVALTPAQQERFMKFVKDDFVCQKYYDEFVVLLGTGLRASEFCGLTISDLDFKQGKIRVDHQLLPARGGGCYVGPPKTDCGYRYIPMTVDVYASLKSILKNRPERKTEIIVDGYSGFILINRRGNVKLVHSIDEEVATAQRRYSKAYPDDPLPHISPHVFRHTFCSNMVNAGMDVKTLQYLMGHASIAMTLDLYAHAGYDEAECKMGKVVDIAAASSE